MAVPDLPLDAAGTEFDLPGGTLVRHDAATLRRIERFGDDYFRQGVTESIAHAWYDGDWSRHPYDEETVPNYTDFQDDGKYSWVKAPRFDGEPMQVGPLAQVLVGYAAGHEPIRRYANDALSRASSIAGTTVGLDAMHSTLGRHLARAVRAAVLAELAPKHWKLLVDNIGRGDFVAYEEPVFPRGEQRGFGFHEAPRGALSHWLIIRDGEIENYQAVVPSTWNAGPRDEHGKRGPYEASLLGNPVADPEKPLEVLRTVHSFDPCIACAIHTADVEGNELSAVRAL
jgi:hydrogenase large subunit